MRLASKSKSLQGAACCFSATVKKSAELSVGSSDGLRSLLESLGIDLDEIIFYWEHLCGQDQTEGLFGIIKRNGDVPTMLRYLLTREKHLSERYKQENPDRGYHYFMGKDSYYPTREQTSHSGGGSGGCDGTASSKKKKVPKPKRCSEENARRMAKTRHFSREHGQAVRQNSVRTASSEAAGCMPYVIGWQLQ